jgi:hypothetical protein
MTNKLHYYLKVAKNTEKGGAWLASYTAKDREGAVIKEGASAWTTSAKAKKWCASQVGRSRLNWEIISATDDNKPLSMKNHTEVKVEPNYS